MRRGWTLIEMIVALAILFLLAGLVFSGILWTRQKAYQSTCFSNLKQIYAALQIYEQDYGELPRWFGPLEAGYVKSRSIFICPAHRDFTFIQDEHCWGLPPDPQQFKAGETYFRRVPPSTLGATNYEISFACGGVSLSQPHSDEELANDYRSGWRRHSGGINFLYADGHVKWVR